MKRMYWLALVLLIILSFAGELFVKVSDSDGHWWSNIPAFYAIFGFIGCVVIIIASKALGKALLQKKEDYYDSE